MVEANVAKRPTTEEDVLIDDSMGKEEHLQAAIKIKAQLSKANKKLEKLEQSVYCRRFGKSQKLSGAVNYYPDISRVFETNKEGQSLVLECFFP